MRIHSILLSLLIFTKEVQAEKLAFNLEPPKDAPKLQSLKLWSTQYFVHSADAKPNLPDTVELRKSNGQSINLRLGHKDWCNAVMEGTVSVKDGGSVRTFNVDGLQVTPQADCSPYFRNTSPAVLARLSRQVFSEVFGSRVMGLGTNGLRLVPYRTIAADSAQFPLGTVLYIAGLRGKTIRLPDGGFAKHDGYVFVADRGGSIKGNHIDFFTGLSSANPAPKVLTSNKRRTFNALVVQDAAIKSLMLKLHRQ